VLIERPRTKLVCQTKSGMIDFIFTRPITLSNGKQEAPYWENFDELFGDPAIAYRD